MKYAYAAKAISILRKKEQGGRGVEKKGAGGFRGDGNIIAIRPQTKQEKFLASPADIVIFGGAAGGGKTWALLMEPLRHVANPKFTAVIFRRSYPQIRQEGGLWDTAAEIYPALGAKANMGTLEYRFPSGATVRFCHLQDEQTIYDWDGAQVPLICWDQLEQFTWRQFIYLLRSNRSMCGVTPYLRATCNPEPDGWLRRFIGWWLNDDTGLPIEERAGQIRYFRLVNDEAVWTDEPGEDSKTVTFIPSRLEDNIILLEKNPEYKASLMNLNRVDRERLYGGNWNIRPSAGNFFRREWFEVVGEMPADVTAIARYWDRAGTKPHPGNPDPDWTSGTLIARARSGYFFICDRAHVRDNPGGVEVFIRNIASQDGPEVEVGLEVDPGQAGKMEAGYLARQLAGYRVRLMPKTINKEVWAKPLSAQAEAGNVKLVRGAWNDSFLRELEAFPEGGHDDDVDSASGAFHMVAAVKRWQPAGWEQRKQKPVMREQGEEAFFLIGGGL